MQTDRLEHRVNFYNNRLKQPPKKKSFETSETINDSLPSIQTIATHEKHNAVRNQLNDTRSQIMLMQAKLQNLRNLKDKFEQRRLQNTTKAEFMNSIRERARQDAQHKQKLQQKREQSQQMLKLQAEYLRQSLVSERRNAELSLLETKMQEAEEERRRRKQEEYLIKRLKEMEHTEKEKKADKVKQEQEKSSSRIKQMQQSMVHFGKEVYHKKVLSAVKERERANSTLKKLKEEQQKLMQDVKASQKAMLTSLYSLQAANPEKMRRQRFHSSDRALKYDHDSYDNQDFES